MARAALPHSRLKARRRRRRVWRAVGVLVAVIGLCALAVGALYLPHLRIVSIAVVGEESVPVAAVAAAAKSTLRGTYFHALPKDNTLMYPKDELVRDLQEKFPALSTVRLARDGLRGLTITVDEYAPFALWCGTSPARGEPCLFLDPSGTAYASAVSTQGSGFVKYYGAIAGSTTPKRFLSREDFRSLTALLAELDTRIADDTVMRVEVDEYDDVRAEFASGFILMFARRDSPAQLLERFNLARQAEPLAERPLSDVEYLDLRFGDKLYYKLKSE